MKPFHLFFIVCLVTVTGCTPSKRLERLLRNNPELRLLQKQDTFELLKTVYIDKLITPKRDNVVVQRMVDSFFRYIDTTDCGSKPNLRRHIAGYIKAKKCIEQTELFTDTIVYADKEIELLLPVTVLLSQTDSGSFVILVQGTGGRVLSNAKAIAITGTTNEEIARYRKQGAWYVGGSLIALLALLGTAYAVYRMYKTKIFT